MTKRTTKAKYLQGLSECGEAQAPTPLLLPTALSTQSCEHQPWFAAGQKYLFQQLW